MSQRTLNSTGNKGRFLIVDNDGKPLTSVVYNTAGLALSVILQNGTEAAITLAAAGDLLNRGKGIYEVAVPNSAYENLGDLTLCGVITDGAVVGFSQQVVDRGVTFTEFQGRTLSSGQYATTSEAQGLYEQTIDVLGVMAGKSSDPVALARLQATDGGATFSNVTRSLEALGDAVGAAQVGDWSITRTFQVSGGAKVSGVRMSLVGVAGKTDTTGTDGVAVIKADDDTFTLRVTVPAGYEDVADSVVTINGADSTATVTLVATTTPAPPSPDACVLSVYVRNQATEPFPGVTVTGRFPRGWSVADGAMNINEVVTGTTDANGLAQLVLLRDQDYDLSFSRANGTIAKIRITTPDAATSTLNQSYQG
jgi:hypothetical protein